MIINLFAYIGSCYETSLINLLSHTHFTFSSLLIVNLSCFFYSIHGGNGAVNRLHVKVHQAVKRWSSYSSAVTVLNEENSEILRLQSYIHVQELDFVQLSKSNWNRVSYTRAQQLPKSSWNRDFCIRAQQFPKSSWNSLLYKSPIQLEQSILYKCPIYVRRELLFLTSFVHSLQIFFFFFFFP